LTKTTEAKSILKAIGLPNKLQNQRSAWTLLALLDLREDDSWSKSKKRIIKIHDIIQFIGTEYGFMYKENSREPIRRQTIHQFIQAGIAELNPDNPNRPTNSPDNVYSVTSEALNLLKKFSTPAWSEALNNFIAEKGTLAEKYDRKKSMNLKLELPNGSTVSLSPGKHNELQVEVIKSFRPRFFANGEIIYLGDTAHKLLVLDKKLEELKVPITLHDKLPDIVLFDPSRNVLVLIEVVTSHGPVTPKRFIELENVLSESKLKRIYVSAFPNFSILKKHIDSIAWETEIWLADKPEHMIHFNGDKFLNC
jgi:hypothetical protein